MRALSHLRTMIIESLVLDAIRLLRQNKSAHEVQSRCGIAEYAEAVKRLQNQPSMTAQQFFAKQEAERREFFRNAAANGKKPQRVSQQDHDYIVGSIFESVDAGTKPTVRPMLEAYGREQNRTPEWAERVAGHKHPRKMGKTLAEYKNHPVLQDLKEGRMRSQTHKSALQNSTYSGFADLLFSGSQNVRTQRAMQQRMDALEVELAAVKTEAARANARIDASEQWKTAAEQLYHAGESYNAISNKVGKSKSTVGEYILARIRSGELEPR